MLGLLKCCPVGASVDATGCMEAGKCLGLPIIQQADAALCFQPHMRMLTIELAVVEL